MNTSLNRLRRSLLNLTLSFAVGALVGCATRADEATDTNTNWLTMCDQDSDCDGRTECLCGVCTFECEANSDCEGVDSDSACVTVSDCAEATAVCWNGEQFPSSNNGADDEASADDESEADDPGDDALADDVFPESEDDAAEDDGMADEPAVEDDGMADEPAVEDDGMADEPAVEDDGMADEPAAEDDAGSQPPTTAACPEDCSRTDDCRPCDDGSCGSEVFLCNEDGSCGESTYVCPPGSTPNGGTKGPDVCADPAREYVADSPEQCAVIRYACGEGQPAFSDECGCGCLTEPPAECSTLEEDIVTEWAALAVCTEDADCEVRYNGLCGASGEVVGDVGCFLPAAIDADGSALDALIGSAFACGLDYADCDCVEPPPAACVDGACVEGDDAALCESTGGTWEPAACGHRQCGLESDCDAVIPGCDCGPTQNFSAGLGCLTDPACGLD
jgi:hypothetical protein